MDLPIDKKEFDDIVDDLCSEHNDWNKREFRDKLFQKITSWLTPLGKVLITDYCCRSNNWPEEFSDYVKERNYTLHSIETYKNLLDQAGLNILQSYDNTNRFLLALET